MSDKHSLFSELKRRNDPGDPGFEALPEKIAPAREFSTSSK